MSKSLKNFTTIKTALATGQFTPRSLRLTFLLGQWSAGVEITDNMNAAVASLESKFNNFFLKCRDVARQQQAASTNGASKSDDTLLSVLEKTKQEVHDALCDSFDTPTAMAALSNLVSTYNSAKSPPDVITLEIGRYVTHMLAIFGLDAEGDPVDATRIGWSGIDIPKSAQPYVYPASQLRDAVRIQARSSSLDYDSIVELATKATAPVTDGTIGGDSNPFETVLLDFTYDVKKLAEQRAPAKDILALCDSLRDLKLWDLGIYLEDRDPPLPAMVRPLDNSLITARQEKDSAAKAKADAKAKREAEEAEKKKVLAEKAKLSHLEMFKTDEYSEWDEQGLPSKEKSGEEVTKSKKKKLMKDWEKQKKLHEDWLKRDSAGSSKGS